MQKTRCDTLHGSRPQPNVNDDGLQQLRNALSRQSANPKLDFVFFPNRRQHSKRNNPLLPLIRSRTAWREEIKAGRTKLLAS